MNFFDWLAVKFGTVNTTKTDMTSLASEYFSDAGVLYFREMAFLSCANLVAKSISKCEFKTYQNGKPVKGPEWYLWNISPNVNQCSSEFIQQWIYQLYRNNEALIIENNGQLFVADDFSKTPYALYDDLFTNVTVKGFTFGKTFRQSDVLYFKLCSENIDAVVNGLCDSYARLITYSMNAYQRSKGQKVLFYYDALPISGTDEKKNFDALLNSGIKTWLTADTAALPLGKGQKIEVPQSKTYSSDSTRDIRSLVDDINDFTAKAFGIPPSLLRGDVAGTSDAVEAFLTFCIDPLVDMMQEEINRKRYGFAGVSKNSYIRIDARQIKHVDILSDTTTNAIDKLIGGGVFCINDIRVLFGEDAIDESWAWEHYITKNYSPSEQVLNPAAGNGGDTG